MRTVILRPRPLPAERAQTPVLLLVVALHVGLLWLASAYWPLKTVLQSASNSFTVQVLQRSAERLAAAAGADATTTNRQQAISQPARQRLGRAEQMLNLPVPATESSTPLAGTAQTAQATPARPGAAAPAEPPAPSTPTPSTPTPSTPILSTAIRSTTASLAVPAPAAAMPAMPTPVTPAAANPVATPETSSPQAQPQVPSAPPAKSVPQARPSPEPAAAIATVRPDLAATSSATPANVASNPGTATATATATSAGAAPAAGSGSTPTDAVGVERGATPAQPAQGASAPLNLAVPPRYLYRPPVAVPGRSLAEMANEQLRRKPRDAFAEGIQDAGSIDCLKDAPGGPDSAAQGLLAIGPLLKRAIEEKCRK